MLPCFSMERPTLEGYTILRANGDYYPTTIAPPIGCGTFGNSYLANVKLVPSGSIDLVLYSLPCKAAHGG